MSFLEIFAKKSIQFSNELIVSNCHSWSMKLKNIPALDIVMQRREETVWFPVGFKSRRTNWQTFPWQLLKEASMKQGSMPFSTSHFLFTNQYVGDPSISHVVILMFRLDFGWDVPSYAFQDKMSATWCCDLATRSPLGIWPSEMAGLFWWMVKSRTFILQYGL